MTTIQQKITTKFLEQLSDSTAVDAVQIAQLKKLLEDIKKAKTDDFVKVFSLPAGSNLE